MHTSSARPRPRPWYFFTYDESQVGGDEALGGLPVTGPSPASQGAFLCGVLDERVFLDVLQILVEGIQASGSREHSLRAPSLGLGRFATLAKTVPSLDARQPAKQGNQKSLAGVATRETKLTRVCFRRKGFRGSSVGKERGDLPCPHGGPRGGFGRRAEATGAEGLTAASTQLWILKSLQQAEQLRSRNPKDGLLERVGPAHRNR